MHGAFSRFLLVAICTHLVADEHSISKKHQSIPYKELANNSVRETQQQKTSSVIQTSDKGNHYRTFTGKVVGNGVRMRLSSDVDSPIIKELEKGELVVVTGEKNDFYIVEAPTEMKAYVFRSLVLDNIVEGNRVNVRLQPDLESQAITTLSQGERVEGQVSDKNPKWLEIAIPSKTRFYIAKEFIDYVGGPELKASYEKKKEDLLQYFESTFNFSQLEMLKPFDEINYDKINHQFHTIINEYKEFPEFTEKAKARLTELHDLYLQKKLAYLETKANQISKDLNKKEHAPDSSFINQALLQKEATSKLTEQMKAWEPAEDALFRAWAVGLRNRTIEDFYEEQKVRSFRITGILEPFNEPIKNKPGSFVVRDRELPIAYAYSTLVNLQPYIGKQVQLVVVPRPNNNFAFPAYFVLSVD